MRRDSKNPASPAPRASPALRYIDRFGRLHTAAVFDAWSEDAFQAMQLRPYDENSDAGAGDGRAR